MYLVGGGVVLLLLYWLGFEPVASWPWWGLLLPFGLAIAWWHWSDVSGRTRRLQEQRIVDRRVARRERAYEAMGHGHKRGRQGGRSRR